MVCGWGGASTEDKSPGAAERGETRTSVFLWLLRPLVVAGHAGSVHVGFGLEVTIGLVQRAVVDEACGVPTLRTRAILLELVHFVLPFVRMVGATLPPQAGPFLSLPLHRFSLLPPDRRPVRPAAWPPAGRPGGLFRAVVARPRRHPCAVTLGLFASLPLPSQTARVEVEGRYSKPSEQGERIQALLKIVPNGTRSVNDRIARQVQHRLRPTQVEKLLADYRAGVGVNELATKYEVHRGTVGEILDRHGVARRNRGIAPDQIAGAIADYQSGASLAALGAKYSVHPATVAAALRRAGVNVRPRNGWLARGRRDAPRRAIAGLGVRVPRLRARGT